MRRFATAAALALSVALVPSPSTLPPRAGRPAAAPRWTDADAAALDARISDLETRLLEHQARVSFWQELRARHESVSAIACQNLAAHATAIEASETRLHGRLGAERKHRLAAAPRPAE